MSTERRQPGQIRDAILGFMRSRDEASVSDIREAVSARLGGDIRPSSVRSYLNLNTPGTFERTGRGHYRLRSK